jgi:TetR/AcrR family transcriptional repressor of mexJK operon
MVEHHAQDKQAYIRESARRRFAYYGYSKVTMDEIAADAGMGKASLYYYFPTKELLFQAVIAHEQKQFVCDIEAILTARLPADQQLRKYVKRRVALFRNFVNLSALGSQSLLDMKTVFRHLFTKLERQELTMLRRIIEAGKRSGDFDVNAPQHAAELLLHVLHGLRLRTLRTVNSPKLDNATYKSLEREMQSLTEIFLHGIKKRT